MKKLILGVLIVATLSGVAAGDAAQHWTNPLEINEFTEGTLNDSSGDEDILLISNDNNETRQYNVTVGGTGRITPSSTTIELEPGEKTWVSFTVDASDLDATQTINGTVTVQESSDQNVQTEVSYDIEVDVSKDTSGGGTTSSGLPLTYILPGAAVVLVGGGLLIWTRRDKTTEYM